MEVYKSKRQLLATNSTLSIYLSHETESDILTQTYRPIIHGQFICQLCLYSAVSAAINGAINYTHMLRYLRCTVQIINKTSDVQPAKFFTNISEPSKC